MPEPSLFSKCRENAAMTTLGFGFSKFKLVYLSFFFCLCLSYFPMLWATEFFQDIVGYYLPPTPLSRSKGFLPCALEGYKVVNIVILGNSKTNREYIGQYVYLKKDSPFSYELYKKTITDLKNLQVFSKVRGDIYPNKDDKSLEVVIEVAEKWTMLPYLIAGSGGGSSYFAVGLYDTNFMGRFYTFNFTYGCKNNNCSSVIFFRNPKLFGKSITYVINPAYYHQIYYIYNSSRNLVGAFSNEQAYFLTNFAYELGDSSKVGLGILYQNNFISQSGLSVFESRNNSQQRYALPPSSSSTALEGSISVGEVDYDGLVANGVNFTSVATSTMNAYASDTDNYTALNNTLLYFKELPLLGDSYFAFRGNVSATSSSIQSQQYFLGGLDKIRGFYDGEFVGKVTWFSNTEFRITSFMNDLIALQNVFFTDSGVAANSFSGVFQKNTAVSVGSGFRILFPNVNKIAIRVDFAYTLNPFQTWGISYGLLQFF